MTPLVPLVRAASTAFPGASHSGIHAASPLASHAATPLASHAGSPLASYAPVHAPAHTLLDAAAHQQTPAPAAGWLVAALVPLLCLLPVLWRVATGTPQERLVAQNLAQLLGALTLLLSAQGFDRPSYQDLALLLAVLAPAGTLVYARFLGGIPPAPIVRWAALIGVPSTVVPLCAATGAGRELLKLLAIGALLLAGFLTTSSGAQQSAEPPSAGAGTPAPGAGPGAGPGTTGTGPTGAGTTPPGSTSLGTRHPGTTHPRAPGPADGGEGAEGR